MTWSSSPVGPSSTSQGSSGGGDGAGPSAGASPASARCCHAGPSRAKASDAGTGSLAVQPSSACRSRTAAGRAASPSPGLQLTSPAPRSIRSTVSPGGRL